MNQNHTSDDSIGIVPDKLEADERSRLDGPRANQAAMFIYVANAFIEPNRQRLSGGRSLDNDFIARRESVYRHDVR